MTCNNCLWTVLSDSRRGYLWLFRLVQKWFGSWTKVYVLHSMTHLYCDMPVYEYVTHYNGRMRWGPESLFIDLLSLILTTSEPFLYLYPSSVSDPCCELANRKCFELSANRHVKQYLNWMDSSPQNGKLIILMLFQTQMTWNKLKMNKSI